MSVYRLEREGNIEGLVELLRSSEKSAVRVRVAQAIGEQERAPDQAVDALIEAAQDDPNDTVRAVAVDSLDTLGGEAIERLLADMAGVNVDGDNASWVSVQASAEALTAEIPELRMAAANAIGRSGDRDAIPQLVERLEDPDPRVRARIARACGLIGDGRAVEALMEATGDERPVVRREAAEALGEIGDADALSPLVTVLKDEVAGVRQAAAGALGGLSTLESFEHLVGALDDEADSVRRTAVYSIIDLLSTASADRSHDRRESVLDALQASDDASVQGPLIDILEESSQTSHRRNAAWLLGRVTGDDPNEAVVETLVEALDDESMVAQFAATSLTAIGGPEVETALLDFIDEGCSDDAAAMAVFTLGKVGGDRARDHLEWLIDETNDEQVRQRAYMGLSKLRGRSNA